MTWFENMFRHGQAAPSTPTQGAVQVSTATVDPKAAAATAQDAVAKAYTPDLFKRLATTAESRAMEFLADLGGGEHAQQFLRDVQLTIANAGAMWLEKQFPPLELIAPLISAGESALFTEEEKAFQSLIAKAQASATAANPPAPAVQNVATSVDQWLANLDDKAVAALKKKLEDL